MRQQEYDKAFDVGNLESKKLQAAFAQVSDIRKFEIELYWKRATYFWALIAVAFAGYFSLLSIDIGKVANKYFLSLIVANIGFVFTFAWFLSCRGSKYWQENWENHMDLLEDAITGPLYKTLLERPEPKPILEKLVTGPMSISVSKVNQWVAVFVLFCWFSLVGFSLYKSVLNKYFPVPTNFTMYVHGVVIAVAITCCVLMFSFGKTHKKAQNPKAVGRYVKIKE